MDRPVAGSPRSGPGPNGRILQYVDDLLISPDEKNAQQHAIQVLNFLAERGYKVFRAKADGQDKGRLPGSSDYTRVQEAVL